MIKKVLPEFQDFLIERGIIRQHYIPFYAHWVSKFLAFSNKNSNIDSSLRVEAFLNHLQGQKNISDWQVQQADNALRLYITNYEEPRILLLRVSSRNQRAGNQPLAAEFSHKEISTVLRLDIYFRYKDVLRDTLVILFFLCVLC